MDWASMLANFGNMGLAVVWSIIGMVIFCLSALFSLKLFDFATKKVDEIGEIKRGNTAVALIFGCLVIGMAYVAVNLVAKEVVQQGAIIGQALLKDVVLWGILGMVLFTLASLVALKLFDFATQDIDEMAEIKRNNIAVALIFGSLIIGMAYVVVHIVRNFGQVILAVVWSIIGMVIFCLSALFSLKLFDFATREIDEIGEIKRGNTAVALIFGGLVIGMAYVVVNLVAKDVGQQGTIIGQTLLDQVVYMFVAVLWSILGMVLFTLASLLALKLFDFATRDIDEMNEIKQGNIAVALIFGSLIIGMAYVVVHLVKLI
jgi:uncharacterized membrane protein YjfL (UPF0719 family)